jgi:hypothetical protein
MVAMYHDLGSCKVYDMRMSMPPAPPDESKLKLRVAYIGLVGGLLVGMVGTVGGALATLRATTLSAETEQQRSRDEFLRSERVHAYTAFISSIAELDTALTNYYFNIINEESAETYVQGQNAMLAAFSALNKAQVSVYLVGSLETAKAAEAAGSAYNKERDVVASIDSADVKGARMAYETMDADNTKNETHSAFVNSAQRDLMKDRPLASAP